MEPEFANITINDNNTENVAQSVKDRPTLVYLPSGGSADPAGPNPVFSLPEPEHHPSMDSKVLEVQLNNFREQGFPLGLAQAIIAEKERCPVRFWIIDNSGSMWACDGHVLRGKGKSTQLVTCTRWTEMQATVEYHAELAGLLQAPTYFLMINNPGDPRVPTEFNIAQNGLSGIVQEIQVVKKAMHACQPQGPSPITARLQECKDKIEAAADQLRRKGGKAVIVLATDGLPTDTNGVYSPESAREFIRTLHSLKALPVWLVVRLCTDDRETVDFYNSLDENLELPLEVIDDHESEQKEITQHNVWLNYGLQLHRVREMGCQNRILDLLDERKLTKDEAKGFLELLFGASAFENAPDIDTDWKGFLKVVSKVVKANATTWNPKSKKLEPWIDVKKLEKAYSREKGGLIRLLSNRKADN